MCRVLLQLIFQVSLVVYMRWAALILCCYVAFPGMAQAQFACRQPVVKVNVEEGTPAEATFYIRNLFLAPVPIAEVTVACGAVVKHYPKGTVQPGQTVAVQVSMDTKRRKGAFAKEFWVYDPIRSTPLKLRLEGTVMPPAAKPIIYRDTLGSLAWEGVRMAVGSFKSYAPDTFLFRCKNISKQSVRLSTVSQVEKGFSVVFADSVIQQGKTTQVYIVYKAYQLRDLSEQASRQLRVRIPLFANALPCTLHLTGVQVLQHTDSLLRAAPFAGWEKTDLIVRVAQSQAAQPITYVVRNIGKLPLHLRCRVPAGDVVEVLTPIVTVLPGATGVVAIRLAKHRAISALHRTVTVEQNDPRTPVQVLHLHTGL